MFAQQGILTKGRKATVQKGTLKNKSTCFSKESLGLRFGMAAQGKATQAVKKGAGWLGGLLKDLRSSSMVQSISSLSI